MSHFDCSDAEGLDLGDRDDDDVVANARRYMEQHEAAHSGEGDDMQDIDKMMGNQGAGYETTFEIERWVANAPLLQLKRASILIDTQVERRKAENEAERKELEKFDKPVRATRKDAGRPRAAKAANDVPRDEKGMAV